VRKSADDGRTASGNEVRRSYYLAVETSPEPTPTSARTADPAREDPDYTPAVYGSLLVTTLIAVQYRFDVAAEAIAFSLLASVGVFWLTHVWSAIVDRRVHGPVGWPEIGSIALGEASMLVAAVIPSILLGLARLGVYSVDDAVLAALIASLVQLFVWGLAVGRAAHSSWVVALVIAIVDLALGVAIVVLKVVVIH